METNFSFPLENHDRKSHVTRGPGFHEKVTSPGTSEKSSLGNLYLYLGRLQLMANLLLFRFRGFHKALHVAGSQIDVAE